MKSIKLGLLALLAMFAVSSCVEDPIGGGTGGGGGTTEEGPELIFVDQAGSLTADSKVDAGTTFTVTLQAARGTADLNSLTIEQDGARIEDFATRVTINNEAATSSARLLTGTEATGFTWDITIQAQADMRKSIYNFIVADDNGNTASRDIEIDTEGGGSGTVEPSLVINGNMEVPTTTNSLVGFPIEALAGSNAMLFISVLDSNNDPIDAARCYFGSTDAADQFATNPLELAADDQQELNTTIYIRSQSDQSVQTYTIVIIDAADNLAFRDVVLNTVPAGNPLTSLTGVLFNRAGPSGTGGLDLDSGASTGSSDTAAELVDNGIDISQTMSNNWIQRISGANGTTLKQLVPNSNGLSESFTFASVELDTQVRDIWVNGIDFTGTNPDTGEAWSDVVNVGDIFIAEREGVYYIMTVTEINIDPTNNDDFYRMDIKF